MKDDYWVCMWAKLRQNEVIIIPNKYSIDYSFGVDDRLKTDNEKEFVYQIDDLINYGYKRKVMRQC